MLSKLILLSLLIFLSACSSLTPGRGQPLPNSYHVPVALDPSMKAWQKAAVLEAMTVWNKQTGYAVVLEEVPFPATELAQERFLGVVVAAIHSDNPNVVLMDFRAGGTVLGVTIGSDRSPASHQTLILMVEDRLPGQAFRDVAVHEIGHAVGIGHTADPNGVMYPTYTGKNSKCLLKSDLDAFCEKQLCKGFDVNPC